MFTIIYSLTEYFRRVVPIYRLKDYEYDLVQGTCYELEPRKNIFDKDKMSRQKRC